MSITPIVPDPLDQALRLRMDGKTKPPGSLGRLEALACQLGRIQHTTTPAVSRPVVVVFAADHGIAARGVSAYPAKVTAQMVRNFAAGGAAINVLARHAGIALQVVDAGVMGDLGTLPGLHNAKVAQGTRDFVGEPAMSEQQLDQALAAGRACSAAHAAQGSTVIGFGEMGIANTSSASMLLSLLGGLPIARCVGPGTGLADAGVAHKVEVLTRAHSRIAPELPAQPGPRARRAMVECGGFEIAMMAGAMAQAAHLRMAVVVDGFIAGAACLAACAMTPALRGYCVFAHRSLEPAHAQMLDLLEARPLLELDMRLGEGTGAALAIPLLGAAAAILEEMASFDSAGVSGPVA